MMEYTSNQVTIISGVSARTLRYYDEIGLLKPARIAPTGYRIYLQAQLDTLQQILLYREMEFPLKEIKKLLTATDYNREHALVNQLAELRKKRARLDTLIETITKSIATLRGEIAMSDTEKFEGFKRAMIENNEQHYGSEIREKYGDAAVHDANATVMGLSPEKYQKAQSLSDQITETLRIALSEGNPASELAQKACALHEEWLKYFLPRYSKEIHRGLAQTYVTDPRFKKYYDEIAIGCAEFFCAAIDIYCV
ncbi:MAG: MerR family transcriptional regulator [Sphaerochaeta sp.]